MQQQSPVAVRRRKIRYAAMFEVTDNSWKGEVVAAGNSMIRRLFSMTLSLFRHPPTADTRQVDSRQPRTLEFQTVSQASIRRAVQSGPG